MQKLFEEFLEIMRLKDQEKEKLLRNFFEKLKTLKIEALNWADEIFEGLHVRQRVDKLALHWVDLDSGKEKKFTYKELALISGGLVGFLREKGVNKGEFFYFMLPLIPEVWFAHYAVVKGGFIGVPLSHLFKERDLVYRFKVASPSAILAEETFTETIDRALEIAGLKPKVKIVVGKKEGWIPFETLSPLEIKGENTRAEDPIFCFFTSGTTGDPKGVLHTAVSYPIGHLSTAYIINLQPEDLHLNLSAPGWGKFAWSSFFAPFSVGATVLGLNFQRFDPERYLRAIDTYKVNTFCAPPTAWRRFIMVDVKELGLRFENLREAVSAGEPLNPEIIKKWKDWTGIEIRDFYGQTESTAMIGVPSWLKGNYPYGSFGKPSFMYDLVLLDEEGREIREPGRIGQIAVKLNPRPIGLFKGYLGMERPESFTDGYYLTGDKAYFDKKGFWYFVARADDVIKTSDYRVGPFEVESVLLEHEAVAEAAVVGSPDPIKWQIVKAFIVLKPGYQPTKELAKEIFTHCSNILPRFKIPRIIEFVESLPKTISGKIKRKELRALEEERKNRNEKGLFEYYYKEIF